MTLLQNLHLVFCLCELQGISNSNIKSGSINDRKDLIQRPNSMALSNSKASKALNKDLGKVSKQIIRY